ncbi:MAG: PSP1 domain-containing protein [Bacteroidota bacterium]
MSDRPEKKNINKNKRINKNFKKYPDSHKKRGNYNNGSSSKPQPPIEDNRIPYMDISESPEIEQEAPATENAPLREVSYVPSIDEELNISINQVSTTHDCGEKPIKIERGECSEESGPSKYAEVAFKGSRRDLFLNSNALEMDLDDLVVVEVENGTDIGKVICCKHQATIKRNCHYRDRDIKLSIIRLANDQDREKRSHNQAEEEYVVETTRELVNRFNLDMKVTEAEWQFDRQRLTIYFTAPQRVDFRELVKELARTFKTRIELRQISTREETKRLGCGIGACGLSLCCTTFLHDFSHVTLDHARTQQLSNNVAKLSGYCGRLKCCLLYEYETYVNAFEKYPPLNSTIDTEEGTFKMMKVDVFKDMVYLYNQRIGKYKTISFG